MFLFYIQQGLQKMLFCTARQITQSVLVAFFTSQGLGGALGSGTPASLSLSLLALPMSHAAVPRLRPHTNPTAANKSMHSLEGLN